MEEEEEEEEIKKKMGKGESVRGEEIKGRREDGGVERSKMQVRVRVKRGKRKK